MEVRIDESRAAFVKTGDQLPVLIDGPAGGQSLNGTVSEVARAIDSDARTFLIKVALPELEGLRSGMYGRVGIPGKVRQAFTLPDAAIVRRGQVTSVFVVGQDRVRLRLVTAGTTRGGATEILAGVREGDVVVVAPPSGLSDGQHVRTSAPASRPATEGGRE